jgi:uncharacterized membrane protein HdeD (DUF308 family)
MLVLMSKNWWSVALRGAVAILFGLLTLIWPGLTILALVLLFGAYVLVDGVVTLAAVVNRDPATAGHRIYFTVLGVASILAGIISFVWPDITALALLYVIAAWAFVTGVMEIAAAVRLRAEIRHEWLLGLAGLLSIVFAVLLVITPGAGALVITWLIGWYAIVFGVVMLMLAWRVRRVHDEAENLARDPSTPPPINPAAI